jgi:hypothetical protein
MSQTVDKAERPEAFRWKAWTLPPEVEDYVRSGAGFPRESRQVSSGAPAVQALLRGGAFLSCAALAFLGMTKLTSQFQPLGSGDVASAPSPESSVVAPVNTAASEEPPSLEPTLPEETASEETAPEGAAAEQAASAAAESAPSRGVPRPTTKSKAAPTPAPEASDAPPNEKPIASTTPEKAPEQVPPASRHVQLQPVPRTLPTASGTYRPTKSVPERQPVNSPKLKRNKGWQGGVREY